MKIGEKYKCTVDDNDEYYVEYYIKVDGITENSVISNNILIKVIFKETDDIYYDILDKYEYFFEEFDFDNSKNDESLFTKIDDEEYHRIDMEILNTFKIEEIDE